MLVNILKQPQEGAEGPALFSPTLHMLQPCFRHLKEGQAQDCCRYGDLIFGTPAYQPVTARAVERAELAEERVKSLKVYVASNDQSLNLETDESYTLQISAPHSSLSVRLHFFMKNTYGYLIGGKVRAIPSLATNQGAHITWQNKKGKC